VEELLGFNADLICLQVITELIMIQLVLFGMHKRIFGSYLADMCIGTLFQCWAVCPTR
jgi:hypothetical protein